MSERCPVCGSDKREEPYQGRIGAMDIGPCTSDWHNVKAAHCPTCGSDDPKVDCNIIPNVSWSPCPDSWHNVNPWRALSAQIKNAQDGKLPFHLKPLRSNHATR